MRITFLAANLRLFSFSAVAQSIALQIHPFCPFNETAEHLCCACSADNAKDAANCDRH